MNFINIPVLGRKIVKKWFEQFTKHPPCHRDRACMVLALPSCRSKRRSICSFKRPRPRVVVFPFCTFEWWNQGDCLPALAPYHAEEIGHTVYPLVTSAGKFIIHLDTIWHRLVEDLSECFCISYNWWNSFFSQQQGYCLAVPDIWIYQPLCLVGIICNTYVLVIRWLPGKNGWLCLPLIQNDPASFYETMDPSIIYSTTDTICILYLVHLTNTNMVDSEYSTKSQGRKWRCHAWTGQQICG